MHASKLKRQHDLGITLYKIRYSLLLERGITLPRRMLIFLLPFPISTNVHDSSVFTLLIMIHGVFLFYRCLLMKRSFFYLLCTCILLMMLFIFTCPVGQVFFKITCPDQTFSCPGQSDNR
jgi:hypothetical protein